MDIDVDEKDANYDFRATCICLRLAALRQMEQLRV